MKIEITRAKKKPPKGRMARRLVLYCIAVLTLTLIWAVGLKTAALLIEPTVSVDVSDILTFVGAAFGGELLLLAFKRVFAKPTDDTTIDGGDL